MLPYPLQHQTQLTILMGTSGGCSLVRIQIVLTLQGRQIGTIISYYPFTKLNFIIYNLFD